MQTVIKISRPLLLILDKNNFRPFPKQIVQEIRKLINVFILLHEKFLQFDWLRAVVFQLNLKYLMVKITNLLRVVV